MCSSRLTTWNVRDGLLHACESSCTPTLQNMVWYSITINVVLLVFYHCLALTAADSPSTAASHLALWLCLKKLKIKKWKELV